MRQDSKGVMSCASIAIFIAIISLLSSLFYAVLIKVIETTGGVPEWVANLSDMLQNGMLYLSFVIELVFFVLFIIWLRTVYGDLHNKYLNLRFAVQWSIWGWFVPIWNFFRPYQVVKDLYVKTNELSSSDARNELRLSLLDVDIWWMLRIVTFLMSKASWQMERKLTTDTSEGWFALAVMNVIVGILNVAFYISARKVVAGYQRVENISRNESPDKI